MTATFMRKRADKTESEPALSSEEPPFSEAVTLPPADSIDLHAFQPKDIPSVVEEYLLQCVEAGFTEVRIVHGKGGGVQRKIVRSILEKNPAVAGFGDAPAEAGGWGATIALLRKI